MAAKKIVKGKTKRGRPKIVRPDVLDVAAEPVAVKPPMSFKKRLFIVLAVLAVGYFLFSSKELFVAATVNGYPVSRLAVVRELEAQGGQQVLDSIVSEMLIAQEARKAKINITEQEIDAKVEEIRKQLSQQGQDLDSLLEAQQVGKDKFRKQIKTQLYVEKLLGDKVEVTDEKLKQFIEANKSFLPTDLSEEELKEMARQELVQQELANQYSAWMAEVKKNADINYFVEY